MMNRMWIGAAVMILFLAGSVCAAPDRSGKWDAGMKVSGAFSDDKDLDEAVFVEGSTSYGINEWLAIGAELGWQERELSNQDLTAVPILADVIVRVPQEPDMQLQPYGIVGVGAIVWDYDDSRDAAPEFDTESSFATKIGGGVDYFLTDQWILNTEVAYIYTNEDVNVTDISRNVDLDYWTAGVGVKHVF